MPSVTAGQRRGVQPDVSKRRPRRPKYRPVMTSMLIAVCVAVYLFDARTNAGFMQNDQVQVVGGETLVGLGRFTLYLPSLQADGEWYRVLTSGFVHMNEAHLGMNMLLLWQLGRIVEGRFGALTFTTLYASGIVGGSVGALVLDADVQVGGASGAIFALMGAMAAVQAASGTNIVRNGLLPLVLVNVALSFLPFVSLGGHLGGLLWGIAGGVVVGMARRSGPRALAAAPVVVAALGFAGFLAAVAIADLAQLRSLIS